MAVSKTGTSSIRSPTPDIQNHQVVLTQLKETTEVAQRLRGNPGDSFVKLSELISAGIVNYIGGVLTANKIKNGNAATINTADSLTGDGSTATPFQLVNDASSPGALKVYGTDGSGVRGWQAVAGGGTVTSVGIATTTLDFTGGPVTTNGDLTLNLAAIVGLTPGSYTNANITVDAYGRVTAATNGSGGGGGGSPKSSKGAAWTSTSGAVVAAGAVQVPVTIPDNCTLVGVDMLSAGGPGSCTFAIWKAPAGTFPPTSAGDITGGAPVGITSAEAVSITSLSGWTTAFSAGDVILFTLLTSSNFTLVSITLRLQ